MRTSLGTEPRQLVIINGQFLITNFGTEESMSFTSVKWSKVKSLTERNALTSVILLQFLITNSGTEESLEKSLLISQSFKVKSLFHYNY